jgi:D-proline reductase (dithiol) PrdB
MSTQSEALGFAVEHDRPIPYLQRITSYYQVLGYGAPYRWAQYAEVPFTPLSKPLAQSRVALITTAAPYQPGNGDQGPGAPYNAAAKFYRMYSDSIDSDPDLRISHIGIDRKHTTAEDINTWFPLKQLKRLRDDGRIGELTPRFYGAPTNRSQRVTIEQDCEELLEALRTDEADVAVIVAN